MSFAKTASLLVAGLLCMASCRDRAQQEYYRTMKIDSATLLVTFTDTLPRLSRHTGRVYHRFDDARRRPGITHAVFNSSGQLTECLESLSLDTTFTLTYREKSRELWRGEFGLILGQSTFFYAPDYGDRVTTFITTPNPNTVCAERATSMSAAPDTTALRLDAISLVLVVPGDSSFTISSGHYAPDGVLQTVTRGIVRRRAGVSPDSLRAENVAMELVAQPPTGDVKYDVPLRLPSRPGIDTTLMKPGVIGFISEHYNHGRIVRQHIKDSTWSTRWLSFAPSYADSVLLSIDETRAFGTSTRRN